MCLSVVYRHLFSSSSSSSPLLFSTGSPRSGRALHGRPPGTMRHGAERSGKGGPRRRLCAAVDAVRASEGVVEGGPKGADSGVGVGRTTDKGRGGRSEKEIIVLHIL